MGILDKVGKGDAVLEAMTAGDSVVTPDRWWSEPQDSPPADAPEPEPVPCPDCGGGIFWQDIYGGLHCGECQVIPARSMVRRFWYLYSAPLRWGPLDEDHWSKFWNPFAHLDDEREKVEESKAF